MPILAEDIEFYYSGGPFNTDKDQSYGGEMSRVQISGVNTRNLFSPIVQAARDIGSVIPGTPGVKDYRVIYVRVNPLAEGNIEVGKLWATIDSISALHYRVAIGPVNTVIQKPSSPYIPPPGMIFHNLPTQQLFGLNIQALDPGDFFAIAIERAIDITTLIQELGGFILHLFFSDLIEELLMEFNTILASGMTPATYGNPNSLGVANPYPNPFVNIQTVSPAWTAQAKKLFFVNDIEDGGGQLSTPLLIIPTAGDATPQSQVTWEIKLWEYDRHSGLWVSAAGGDSEGWTGPKVTYIYKPLYIPQFIQVVSVSNGGSLAIRLNNVLTVVA